MDDHILFDSDYRSMNDAAYWDFRAKDYSEQTSEKLDPTAEKQRIVQELFDRGILTENSRVLDLGCGPGWYSRAFALRVGEVVGIDISENMLEYARQNNADLRNVQFVQMDWATADVSSLGKFDLVFGNMSPAIYDDRTLEKMMSVCCGYCWYSHFAHRYCNVTNALDAYFGIERKLERIRLMFDYLWDHGYLPEIYFQRKGGQPSVASLDELVDYYRHEYRYPESEDDQIRDVLRAFENGDGQIERISWFDKGILTWRVNKQD